MEGSETIAAIGGVRTQDMGSGGPRPGGSAMDRISGSPSGNGLSASGLSRAASYAMPGSGGLSTSPPQHRNTIALRAAMLRKP